MESSMKLKSMITTTVLLLLMTPFSHVRGELSPLCISEFALATEACSPLEPGNESFDPIQGQIEGRDLHQQELLCCRKLTMLDTGCVCNVFRILPVFLRAPEHKYSVRVGSTCEVAFPCSRA